MIGYQKVGGLAFLRVGPLSMSFCLTTKPIKRPIEWFPAPDALLILALSWGVLCAFN